MGKFWKIALLHLLRVQKFFFPHFFRSIPSLPNFDTKYNVERQKTPGQQTSIFPIWNAYELKNWLLTHIRAENLSKYVFKLNNFFVVKIEGLLNPCFFVCSSCTLFEIFIKIGQTGKQCEAEKSMVLKQREKLRCSKLFHDPVFTRQIASSYQVLRRIWKKTRFSTCFEHYTTISSTSDTSNLLTNS